MSRLQLALNVSDLDAAIGFYSRLLDSRPAKVRPGYANFAIADPPLKLVLMETPGSLDGGLRALHGALNHLGVEVATTEEHRTVCCHALADKVWVKDPDAVPWEVYAVLADVTPPDSRQCR